MVDEHSGQDVGRVPRALLSLGIFDKLPHVAFDLIALGELVARITPRDRAVIVNVEDVSRHWLGLVKFSQGVLCRLPIVPEAQLRCRVDRVEMLDEAEPIPEFDGVSIDFGLRHRNGALIAVRIYDLGGLDLPVAG